MIDRRIARQLFAVLTTAMLLTSGAAAAYASPTLDSKAEAAESIFLSVLNSTDQAAALAGLSSDERALFDLWTTPGVSTITTTTSAVTSDAPGATARATCSTWTQRGSFSNRLGAKLGSFYTTGSGCRSESTMTSATFVDGGGQTSALGWSYVGNTAGKGIVSNVAYIYGAHKFKLNIAGIDVQQPTYCARAKISPVVATGDLTCGLG